MRHHLPILAVAAVLAAPAAHAQAAMDGVRAAAANQVGVLQYCQAQGHAGADAVTAGRDALARMPASAGATDAAETLGRQGTVLMPDGTQAPLASVAGQYNTSPATMCKQMADAALQADAAAKSGTSAGGIPGLPVITGTPGVPGLAPTPGMPGVSGAPAR